MRRLSYLFVGVCLLLASSCAEPPRDHRVQRIAEIGCDRFDECGEIGSDARYDSYGECISSLEDTFYDLWPDDECGDGQINRDEYRRCLDRARNYPCDSNLFDDLSFASSCSADDVCIDPRN